MGLGIDVILAVTGEICMENVNYSDDSLSSCGLSCFCGYKYC